MGGFYIFEPPFISIVIDGRPSCEIPPAFFGQTSQILFAELYKVSIFAKNINGLITDNQCAKISCGRFFKTIPHGLIKADGRVLTNRQRHFNLLLSVFEFVDCTTANRQLAVFYCPFKTLKANKETPIQRLNRQNILPFELKKMFVFKNNVLNLPCQSILIEQR